MNIIFKRIAKKAKQAFFNIIKDEAIALGDELFGDKQSKSEEPIVWVRENGVSSSPRWNVFRDGELIGRVLHREKLDVPKQWKLLLPKSSETIYFADKNNINEELKKRANNAS